MQVFVNINSINQSSIHLFEFVGNAAQSMYRLGDVLRVLRLQDSRRMKVVSLSFLHTGRLYPTKITPGTHFYQMLSQLQSHSVAGRTMSMKHYSDTIGNRSRDLPSCSTVPQPTGLSREFVRTSMNNARHFIPNQFEVYIRILVSLFVVLIRFCGVANNTRTTVSLTVQTWPVPCLCSSMLRLESCSMWQRLRSRGIPVSANGLITGITLQNILFFRSLLDRHCHLPVYLFIRTRY